MVGCFQYQCLVLTSSKGTPIRQKLTHHGHFPRRQPCPKGRPGTGFTLPCIASPAGPERWPPASNQAQHRWICGCLLCVGSYIEWSERVKMISRPGCQNAKMSKHPSPFPASGAGRMVGKPRPGAGIKGGIGIGPGRNRPPGAPPRAGCGCGRGAPRSGAGRPPGRWPPGWQSHRRTR